MRRCDLELLLWKSVVVVDNGDDDGDENEDEVGLDDRLDPVETICYFPMASALSFFDTSRFAHSFACCSVTKFPHHLRKIVSPDIAHAILNNL